MNSRIPTASFYSFFLVYTICHSVVHHKCESPWIQFTTLSLVMFSHRAAKSPAQTSTSPCHTLVTSICVAPPAPPLHSLLLAVPGVHTHTHKHTHKQTHAHKKHIRTRKNVFLSHIPSIRNCHCFMTHSRVAHARMAYDSYTLERDLCWNPCVTTTPQSPCQWKVGLNELSFLFFLSLVLKTQLNHFKAKRYWTLFVHSLFFVKIVSVLSKCNGFWQGVRIQ